MDECKLAGAVELRRFIVVVGVKVISLSSLKVSSVLPCVESLNPVAIAPAEELRATPTPVQDELEDEGMAPPEESSVAGAVAGGEWICRK